MRAHRLHNFICFTRLKCYLRYLKGTVGLRYNEGNAFYRGQTPSSPHEISRAYNENRLIREKNSNG